MRIAAVSYLNTKPFTEGLEATFAPHELTLTLLPPSRCAEAFASGQADLALVPVGALLGYPEVHLLGQYCIGAAGSVDSVFLVAQQPRERLTTVYRDPQSRTSNGLAQVLFANHWRQTVAFETEPDYLDQVGGTAGGVVIGDRAIAVRDQFAEVIDLAQAWFQYTGLPFAFAVWVYRPEALHPAALERVLGAFELGMAQRHRVAAKWASAFEMSPQAAERYLTQAIDYPLNAPKWVALERYLTELAALSGQVPPRLKRWQTVAS